VSGSMFRWPTRRTPCGHSHTLVAPSSRADTPQSSAARPCLTSSRPSSSHSPCAPRSAM
jgi:hypothetical protein